VAACEDDAVTSRNVDLGRYYRERAEEYDQVYAKPERQADILVLKSLLPGLVAGVRVLEIAAGTGYWTEALSASAAQILATDINPETLAVARRRHYHCPVEFTVADAYDLGSPDGSSQTAFVGFWWSHVARRDLQRFLASLHRRLGPGREVILLDNLYVEGSNHPITRTDSDGNTYQLRRLANDTRHEVLKNFPTEANLQATLAGYAASVAPLRQLDYYWLLTYTTASDTDP
jgi:ubiquinone/menaquinone biosynthesis C-methylase UbiE